MGLPHQIVDAGKSRTARQVMKLNSLKERTGDIYTFIDLSVGISIVITGAQPDEHRCHDSHNKVKEPFLPHTDPASVRAHTVL